MRYLIAEHSLSVQRSCACVGLSRAAHYKETVDWAERDAEVVDQLNKLIEKKMLIAFSKADLVDDEKIKK